MIYEVGKSYILQRDGITIRVEEIDELLVTMRLLTDKEGKIPDEEEYIQGPSENFQGWMTFQQAKEVNNVQNRTNQTGERHRFDGPDNSGSPST